MNAIIKITGEITLQEGERICTEFLDAEKREDILQIIFFDLISEGDNKLERFKRSPSVILLFGVAETIVRNKTGSLLLFVVTGFAIGPALGYSAERPVLMYVFRNFFGQLDQFLGQFYSARVNRLWLVHKFHRFQIKCGKYSRLLTAPQTRSREVLV